VGLPVSIEESAPRFACSRTVLMAARILIVAAIALTIAVVIQRGWSGFTVLPVTIVFGVVGAAVLRFEVAATPDFLVVNNGLWRREFQWRSIEGFRIDTSQRPRRLLVLIGSDRTFALPVSTGTVTRRRALEDIRQSLEDYRNNRS
jgi:hypothetical protein